MLFVGDASNQIALANKVHSSVNTVGIVAVKKNGSIKRSFSLILDKILARLLVPELTKSWQAMLRYYHDQFNNWPTTPKIDVNDVNDQMVINFVNENNPDLIVVSGTNLLSKDLLKTLKPSIGIINLHTGLSPYVKGGPNCTNWCIANGDYHLIGNTVMWINSGIDSGNIVASELTQFTQLTNSNDPHIKVMEHAHDLLLRCINSIETNPKNTKNIPQKEISDGNLFLTKDWTFSKKLAFKKNIKWFLENYNSDDITRNKEKIITVRI